MTLVLDEHLIRFFNQTKDIYGDEIFLNYNDPSKDNSHSSFSSNITSFENQINKCHKCDLGYSRTNFVFGIGDPDASLMLVGEAPGEKEDIEGEPFVGRAGKLLDKILIAIGRSRNKDVFICKVLKCRPPNNRDPLSTEVKECEPYLKHQINLIKPKLIVALGRIAGKTLLGVDNSLKSMRGDIHNYYDIPLIVTYHPAALLRNPNWKPQAWKDFKWIKSIIES